jgi:hypothetical protein
MSYHLPFEVFHNTMGEGMAVAFVDKNGSSYVKVQFGEKTAEFAYPEQFCFHLRAKNPLVQAEIRHVNKANEKRSTNITFKTE